MTEKATKKEKDFAKLCMLEELAQRLADGDISKASYDEYVAKISAT